MTKYRVYIKEAEEDLVGNKGFDFGYINAATGESIKNTSDTSIITNYFIPIEYGTRYEMIRTSGSSTNPIYYICEYDSNYQYIRNSTSGWSYGSIPMQLRNGNATESYLKKIYTPSENAKYIKIQTESKTSSFAYEYMFLKMQKPILIHDSMSPNKEDHLLNCNLHLEDCSAGSLEFTIWPGHSYYKNKINIWTDTLYVTRTYNNGSERIIWDGRVISEDVSTDMMINYHCEGALAYLNDFRVNEVSQPILLTIADFIFNYIISYHNDISITQNRMDRSLYYGKDSGELIDSASILCDYGVKYTIQPNRESGLKWINDIKEAFGGHYKIRYRSYDSPYDDIICRCFTYVQKFDGYIKIKNWNNIPITGQSKFRNVAEGTSIFYKNVNSILIYRANKTFAKEQTTIGNYIANGYLSRIYEEAPKVANENLTSDAYEYWVIDNTYVIQYPYRNRYQKIYAKFGSEIFEASKSTEINDFASVIIPRGVQGTTSSDTSTNVYINTKGIFIDGKQKEFNDYINGNGELSDRSLIKKYGVVKAVVDFEGANTPRKLYNQAQEWFRELKNKLISKSISITLSGLSKLVNNSHPDPLSDPEYIDIWTRVYATIPELGITENDPEIYYVSSLDIPLDDYLNTSITLINNADLISNQNISNGDIKGTSKGIIDSSS